MRVKHALQNGSGHTSQRSYDSCDFHIYWPSSWGNHENSFQQLMKRHHSQILCSEVKWRRCSRFCVRHRIVIIELFLFFSAHALNMIIGIRAIRCAICNRFSFFFNAFSSSPLHCDTNEGKPWWDWLASFLFHYHVWSSLDQFRLMMSGEFDNASHWYHRVCVVSVCICIHVMTCEWPLRLANTEITINPAIIAIRTKNSYPKHDLLFEMPTQWIAGRKCA